MSLTFNVKHVERDSLRLQGELTPVELDLEQVDELVQFTEPVVYDLVVEKVEQDYLVQGRLSTPLRCKCARCLRAFSQNLEISQFVVDLPTQGEEAVAVANDSIDLTPYVREDILLELPQHPLCEPECRGLEKQASGSVSAPEGPSSATASVWDELNKLKL